MIKWHNIKLLLNSLCYILDEKPFRLKVKWLQNPQSSLLCPRYKADNIPVAAVATGFPSGQYSLHTRQGTIFCRKIKWALTDIYLPKKNFFEFFFFLPKTPNFCHFRKLLVRTLGCRRSGWRWRRGPGRSTSSSIGSLPSSTSGASCTSEYLPVSLFSLKWVQPLQIFYSSMQWSSVQCNARWRSS